MPFPKGAAQFPSAAFAQQSYVGVADQKLGTVTMGRGFTTYFWMLSPYSPVKYLPGPIGAHPGDVDNLDIDYKTSNTIRYISPVDSGVTFSGGYSLSGVPGCTNCGASWSAGANYIANSFGIAAAIERFNNSNSQGGVWGANSTATANGEQAVSAITNGFQTAAAQQRFAVTGGYTFNDKFDKQLSYSNVQYIPGNGSSY
jgi:predicted porin